MAVEAQHRVLVNGSDGTSFETWVEDRGTEDPDEVLVVREVGVRDVSVTIALSDLGAALQAHDVKLPGWVCLYA